MNDPTIEKLNDAGLRARYKGSTRGGEYHAPCPFCLARTGDGGKDRLCIWPTERRFWCRQGGCAGSLASLYAQLAGVTETHARQVLGLEERGGPPSGEPGRGVIDKAVWMAQAERVVKDCVKALFEPRGEVALNYLKERGLNEQTIRAARLGVCPENRVEKREAWGLRPEINPETGRPRKVFMRGGSITLPHFDTSGRVCKLQTRCEEDTETRYRVLQGSSPVGMVLLPEGNVEAAVVVESSLDAILCHQEVPQGIAFVALGSASQRPHPAADAVLRSVKYLLVATDADEAGIAAFGKLRAVFPHAVRLPLPIGMGKDVGEARLLKLNLQDWCEVGIGTAKERGAANRMRRKAPSTKTGAQKASTAVEVACELDVQHVLVSSEKAAAPVIEELLSATGFGIDIETTAKPQYSNREGAALDPWCSTPRLVQVTAGGKVWIFDLARVPLPTLAPLLERPWYAHNALFEVRHFMAAGLSPGDVRCTMLQDNALTNQNRSLSELYKAHFGVVLDKTMQTSDWSGDLSDAQLRYAARDALAAYHLAAEQGEQLRQRGTGKLARLLYDAQYPVAWMALNGLGFDQERHQRLLPDWLDERERALRQLRALAGRDLNMNSPKQLAAFFERHATPEQLKAWPRGKAGDLTTAQDELAAFADNAAVAALLDYRKWDSLVSRYGDTLAAHIHPETGRLHPDFRIAAARTGRMAVSNPNVHGFPREVEFRRLFVADSGWVSVRADFNQAQLRIAALLSGDARLLRAYEQGLDVHRMTAASIVGKDADAVSPEERNLAKAIAFGLLFGMGARGLARYARANYGITLAEDEAEQIRRRFFETYPELGRWQRDRVAEVKATGSCTTPMGRVRNFVREDKEDFYTAAMNTPIQGGEAEVLYATLALLPTALEPHGACLLNAVHDELLVECPEDNVAEVGAALRDCMERGMRRVFPDATLNGLVEVGAGPTWGDAK